MKRSEKNAQKAYSFDEYKRKFSSPLASKKAESRKTPYEWGVKLAEESLAKARRQLQRS
jgi:hypothetical protein